ncbi:DUF5708 family protein [Streptomyces griseus]|uniref:DUF5708 family protein n=1 Tax=Streptomyces griseus TaxID=1911 RepID=UPI0005660966|nr:DUF5708 family protein [Streptomyces griseus]
MSRASKNLLEGAVTLVIGLALKLFAVGVDLPVVAPTKVGVVLMCVGGALVATGLYQATRAD